MAVAPVSAGLANSPAGANPPPPLPAPPHSHAHAMTNVYFLLNWLPNVEFAGLWVAQQKGWFQKAGIKMNFTPWSNAGARRPTFRHIKARPSASRVERRWRLQKHGRAGRCGLHGHAEIGVWT